MYLLTVIVPFYNVEKYLSQCLKSIYVNDSRILYYVVDDGSEDESLRIAQKFAERKNNVKVIGEENRGVWSARNKALDLTSSEWVTFVDSDDYVDRLYFQKLLNILRHIKNCDLISLPILVQSLNKKKVVQSINKEFSKEEIVKRITDGRCQVGACTFVFKTKILNKYNIRFPNEHFEDKYFVPDYISHVESVKSISGEKIGFYHYRMRKSSFTHSNVNLNKIKAWYKSGKYMNDKFLSFNNIGHSTILSINENKYMILFRTYIDLLKIGKFNLAKEIKTENINFLHENNLKFNLKVILKAIILMLPTRITCKIAKFM